MLYVRLHDMLVIFSHHQGNRSADEGDGSEGDGPESEFLLPFCMHLYGIVRYCVADQGRSNLIMLQNTLAAIITGLASLLQLVPPSPWILVMLLLLHLCIAHNKG
jgi:hypothetical protein